MKNTSSMRSGLILLLGLELIQTSQLAAREIRTIVIGDTPQNLI